MAVPAFSVPDDPPDLLSLAVNNAVEGCANEAAAALLAHVLAKTAPTPSLRKAFARIAADETGHAQLSWDLHAWFVDQLDADGVAEVEAALERALATIPSVLARESATLPFALGLPALGEAGQILSGELLRS